MESFLRYGKRRPLIRRTFEHLRKERTVVSRNHMPTESRAAALASRRSIASDPYGILGAKSPSASSACFQRGEEAAKFQHPHLDIHGQGKKWRSLKKSIPRRPNQPINGRVGFRRRLESIHKLRHVIEEGFALGGRRALKRRA